MVCEMIKNAFAGSKDKTIIEYEDKKISFQEYLELVEILKKGFCQSGLGPDNSVAVLLKKSYLGFFSFSALSEMGSIQLMMDPNLSEYELEKHLGVFSPDYLITDTALNIDVKSAPYHRLEYGTSIKDAPIFIYKHQSLDGSWKGLCNQKALKGAVIFFSSGSTDMPKAVVRTQDNILKDAINNIETFSIASKDKVLCAASFSHVYGFGSGSIPYFTSGATVKFINPFTTINKLHNELNNNGYSIFVGLPIHYKLLLDNCEDRLNLRIAFSAGGVISSEIVNNIYTKTGIRINNMYGMSELGGITTLYENMHEGNLLSVGTPLSNVQVRLGEKINDEGDDHPLFEIYVKSNTVSPGYYDTNKKALTGILLEDGWFNTNDLGYMTEDGSVYIKSRKQNMINTSGKKINPLEIENIICQFQGIREAVVIGKKDEERGEVPVAYIVAEPTIDKQALLSFCYTKLPMHKIPKEVTVIEKLPKTRSGKVRRHDVGREVQ